MGALKTEKNNSGKLDQCFKDLDLEQKFTFQKKIINPWAYSNTNKSVGIICSKHCWAEPNQIERDKSRNGQKIQDLNVPNYKTCIHGDSSRWSCIKTTWCSADFRAKCKGFIGFISCLFHSPNNLHTLSFILTEFCHIFFSDDCNKNKEKHNRDSKSDETSCKTHCICTLILSLFHYVVYFSSLIS